MRTLRHTPSVLPTGTRRHQPWKSGSRSVKVPIVSEGEWLEGRFEVPARLSNAQPHTNDWHEFQKIVEENTARWLEYRRLRGWDIVPNKGITWRGPYPVPTRTEMDDSEEEIVHYFLCGYFKTNTPLYVGLDDVLFERDKAKRFGVDPDKPKAPANAIGNYDSGWVDPLKHAAESGIDTEYRHEMDDDGGIILPKNPGVNPL